MTTTARPPQDAMASRAIALATRSLSMSFGSLVVARDIAFELPRGARYALIGPNGAGKTTFLRNLLGQLDPLSGELKLGASLKIGYFAQAHEDLNPKLTLIEEIERVGAGMLVKDIRSYLGRFLFSGDDHYKKVEVLSGGERGRLALAKLSLLDANLLLLDEPSNHLDIPAQEVLQQVLAEFDGTILMVSHDRYLIDALATQIWEIQPDDQSLVVFNGSYSQYKGINEDEAHNEKASVPVKSVKGEQNGNGRPEEQPKVSKYELKRRQEKINELEDQILKLESKLEDLGKKLSDPPEDTDEIIQLSEDYAYTEAELGEALKAWEALHE